ncbi:serine/threonine protein kinase [Streptomyces sp. NBC_00006]|uniref:serine/threonine-protein kinase n=1 Tax=Streptomyces sp. NBC_00006 TaxID=2975619 RepID=UPI002254E1E0|nr:serine/threonine-protein kinase [Streptomyces sp. NBC_00006]MCX5529781.1 serine/threonine protein kinase [Streptomyces sp. NBC_00006]
MRGNGLPQYIGPYAVERSLGAGGMGEVYLAYSLAGDPVAVKVIRPDRTDPHTRARFEREATIARTISGTGRVARFIDADPFAEQPWLAIDYVPGRPLADVVKEQGPLDASLVASLGALLAEGLAAVHDAGLVHRDLKAQNVILGGFGPVIIDFGLGAFLDASKGSLSQAGMLIGTVRCMPPEQALGEVEVTPAADVYGLGTVLLYAATGHYPYDGSTWPAVATQVANPDIAPDLTGLPVELLPVVTGMLTHRPEDRPALGEVTRQCADLLRRLGMSPARARRSLIRKTTAPEDHPTMVLPRPDTLMLDRIDSLERRLLDEELVEEPDSDAASSSSSPSSEPDSETPLQPEPVPAPAPDPGPADGKPGGSAPRRGRPPASRRVAQELRERYATGAALAWSKR